MWEEGPRAGMLKRILGGEVRDETIGKYWRKRKYGNVERDASKKKNP